MRSLNEYVEEELLNVGLAFAMEWGQHWLEPIQNRMKNKFPNLPQEKLDHYNEVCRAARDMGIELLPKLLEDQHTRMPKLCRDGWRKQLLENYP